MTEGQKQRFIEMSVEELQRVVRTVTETVWHDDDPETVWDPATIETVASILEASGLRPGLLLEQDA